MNGLATAALVYLILAVVGASNQSTVPSPDPGTPPPGPRLFKFSEITSVDDVGYFTYDCDKFFGSSPLYFCSAEDTSQKVTLTKVLDGFIAPLAEKLRDQSRLTTLLLYHENPQVYQRLLKAYQTMKSKEAAFKRFTFPILEIIVHQDFSLVILDGSTFGNPIFEDLFIPDGLYDGDAKSLIKQNWVHAAKIFDMLRDLHRSGNVAINFHMSNSSPDIDGFLFRFAQIGSMVGVGEEVGDFPFSPILTDPVALKDPHFKADPALDYFTLGVWLARSFLPIKRMVGGSVLKRMEISSRVIEGEAFLRDKQKGEFEFPENIDMGLAFLAACFLQDDRTARVSTEAADAVGLYLSDSPVSIRIQKTFVYKTSTDPWTLPEFQEFVNAVGPRRAQSNNKPTVSSGGLSDWTLVLFGIAGIVAVAVTVYFCVLKKKPEEGNQADPKKPLDEPTDGQVVVATSSDN